MNATTKPPPAKAQSGCFGKGCLTVIVVAILLIVIGVGGAFWSVRHVYLSDKPAPIPQTAAETITSAVAPEQPSVPPAVVQRSAEVRERLDTMKKTARTHEPTDVELTAADINSLIAANRKSRGTASVEIDGNTLQANFAIPLNTLDVPFRNAFGLSDRYLNASVTIVAPPGTNASNVQPDVQINGHSIPGNVLDWGLPGVGRSLRSYVIKYANQYGVTDGEITDGKVILHTSGR